MPDTSESTSAPVPLLAPAEGVPPVVQSVDGVRDAAARLAGGTGPLAVDAERASGFRYSSRAYLIQLRRAGAGTVLLDPIPVSEDLGPLRDAINDLEWVLHSADQDLPCLAELGLAPARMFDTELAGRLAGFERVGLAAIVERTLGLELRKGHGAADWSSRPLPDAWLNYAALDVEVLLELRDAMAKELASQDKTEWARQEFEHVRLAGPPRPKPDRWRRTSQIHSLKSPRQLAAVRELWTARDEIASKRDISPSRILPDSAIVAAASADPRSVDALRALQVFGGPRQRRSSRLWLAALERARALPPTELPPINQPFTGPPPPSRWAKRDPAAAARLNAAKTGMTELSERVKVPVENLLSPDLVRRVCWEPPAAELDQPTAIDAALAAGGARPWQRELTVPVLVEAVRAEP
ncbi:ribonuclease D [Rhodococcus sp. ABRD24]|uniref:HRDC domain-containing protein n=1 Tax=Rhodococcus sp. ABRD24 TaxID=2507582 RepID=UPI001039DE14|nr:ribonuclease D [Rhodococcus sp. ABRD24]QBJ98284.1 ribonuclease D [Rhodococcus sp. ABRD24]